jgi:hypothetical protein
LAVEVVLALPWPRSPALSDRAGVAGLPALRRDRDRPPDRVWSVNNPCPYWCAGGHRCNRALDEHRSDPWPMGGPYGTLVATRLRTGGRDFVELRALVALPVDEHGAEDLARAMAVGVDLTIAEVAGGRLRGVWRRFERLTGVRVR